MEQYNFDFGRVWIDPANKAQIKKYHKKYIPVILEPYVVQANEWAIYEWVEEYYKSSDVKHIQLLGSPYIFHHEFQTWWFKNEQDAIHFRLKWGGVR